MTPTAPFSSASRTLNVKGVRTCVVITMEVVMKITMSFKCEKGGRMTTKTTMKQGNSGGNSDVMMTMTTIMVMVQLTTMMTQ